MIRSADLVDLSRIQRLLVDANDEPYDIGRVAEEKCFGPGFEGQPEVRIFGDFEGLSVTCGKYLRLLAVDRSRRGRGVGSALLRDAEARRAFVIGAEPGNYFTPGVSESLVPFFTKRGYRETARTQNLICHSEPPQDGEESASQERGGSFAVEACPEQAPQARVERAAQDDKHREAVLHFIEQNFGPIWRFEASRGAALFSVEHDGQIAGFSTHEANNRGLGTFGPAGVSEALRGHGLGRKLLVASLADLSRLGYHRAVIPWTDAIEFYRKSCGAKIAHRFVILRKNA